MKPKILIAGAILAGAALFVGAALVPLRIHRSDAATGSTGDAAKDAATASALLPNLLDDVDDKISALETKMAERPTDAKLHAQLGLTYLQKARNEADPSTLPDAEEALRASLELEGKDNLPGFVGMASLSNFRHDFSGSVKWSRKAIALNPYSASAYGLLGDALFELGRVHAAEAAYQDMVDLRPDVASYVRASYTLQYRGATQAAIRAMRLAVQAAGPTGESAAYVRHQLGDIYHAIRDYKESERQNRIGTKLAPGFIPPTVGIAEAYVSQGRLRDALRLVKHAAAELPSLEYTIKLGDLNRALGNDGAAQRAYAAVAEKLGDYRRNGVNPDADFIVFYADHGLRPQAALREAFSIYENRPTGKIADSLGWMLHSVGRDRQAMKYALEAISAPIAGAEVHFHAAQIARALGHRSQAERLLREALHLDPVFSVVQAPIARRELKELSS
jgi:tetratricopeptide (TPR) repeat protein